MNSSQAHSAQNPRPQTLQRGLAWLFAAYTLASLTHFVHNAEYIAFYPGMPRWITAQTVYLAWLGVAAVGGLALLALRVGWKAVAYGLMAAYGALGLDGLLHYTLALCSEHTLATNITIWAEVGTGLALLLVGSVLVVRSCSGGAMAMRRPA